MSTSAAVPPAVADRAVSSVEGESFAEPRLARPPVCQHSVEAGWTRSSWYQLGLVLPNKKYYPYCPPTLTKKHYPSHYRTLTLTKKHNPYHYHNLTLTKKHNPYHYHNLTLTKKHHPSH
ncbi:unnamed protein product [Arctogadus glacialis]